MRTSCGDCDWTYKRALDENENLIEKVNREIAMKIAHYRAFNFGEGWKDNGAIDIHLEASKNE